MTLPAEIANRPCPDLCAEPGHKYRPDSGCEWDYTREHPVTFRRPWDSEPPMVSLSAMDEFAVGSMRGPGVPDEDHIGMAAVCADERFLLDGCSAEETREFAAKALRLAAELLAAAERLDEITGGSR